MGQTRIFVDNLLSKIQYPNHAVSATESAVGHGVSQLVSGRRDTFNYWTAVTPSIDQDITVDCGGVLRAANMIAMDWYHNLAGKVFELHVTNDDFTTTQIAFSATIPSVVGGSLLSPNGVVTEEGAWLKALSIPAAGTKHRIHIPNMGGIPRVPLMHLGMYYEPQFVVRPMAFDRDILQGESSEVFLGRTGIGRTVQVRQVDITVKIKTPIDYDLFRYHVQGHYGAGRPAWVILDTDMPERAWMTRRLLGDTLGLEVSREWGFEQGTIRLVEFEPKVGLL